MGREVLVGRAAQVAGMVAQEARAAAGAEATAVAN